LVILSNPIGVYSLSNYQHARIEAATLDKMKLFYIAFKKHDPLQIVHDCCQYLRKFKGYSHEDIPFDKVFQKAQYYEDVCKRVEEVPKGPKINSWVFEEM